MIEQIMLGATPILVGLLLLCVVLLLFVIWRMKSSQSPVESIHQELERILNEKLAQQNQFIEQRHADLRESQIEKLGNNALQIEQAFRQFQEQLSSTNSQSQQTLGERLTDLSQALIKQQTELQKSLSEQFDQQKATLNENLADGRTLQQRSLTEFKESLLSQLQQQAEQSREAELSMRDKLVVELRESIKAIREELSATLQKNTQNLLDGMGQLTKTTDEKLKEISGQVEKRLAEGFDKTTQTFHDVLKRLALIDEAQKKITELSTNVVSLQQVLSDKRSRGAFGEVQLNALIQNVLPKSNFSLQHTLSNGKIVDALLMLPEPTGNVAVDAKFPLESYQKMTDFESSDLDRKAASQQFKQDIKKHISDITSKYIIEGETAGGAVMFIPAEAVFAEIHAHFPELVDLAHKSKVWMVSPTTMMAILTTASAVIKDEATRQQVHIIQEHLVKLSEDFKRFRTRMDSLSKHITQVSTDVQQITTSANKITSRFEKIEKVELPEGDDTPLIE